MSRVVLVTGISRYLACRLAGRLSADPGVDRIIGVDTVPPPRAYLNLLGRAEFVRADIRNPLISRVISQAEVDTVVHASLTATPHGAGGRAPMKELNVIGTMQLLAACQNTGAVRRLVVKSSTAVYGTSPRDPALFTEEMTAKALPRSGYAKDAVEVEGYLRGFTRRRPDVAVTLLRFANVVGPSVDTPLTRYFQLPVVPTVFGFDPRLQLLHENDAVEVLRLATVSDRPGTFNVAADGVLLLSQAIRRAGKIAVPVPAPAVQLVGRTVRRSGLVDFSPEQMQFLNFGRVVATDRLKQEFGFAPQHSTAAAFEDFLAGHPVRPVLSEPVLDAGAALLARLLRTTPPPASRPAASVTRIGSSGRLGHG